MRILLMEKVVISSAYINLEASADYDENFRFCVESEFPSLMLVL